MSFTKASSNAMKKLGITIALLLIYTATSAGETLYRSNYDEFWKQWNTSQAYFSKCTSNHNVMSFVKNALSYLGNAEVTEANAETIEKLAVKNPVCLIQGISKMSSSELDKFHNSFLKYPLFTSSKVILESIQLSGALEKHENVKAIFTKEYNKQQQ